MGLMQLNSELTDQQRKKLKTAIIVGRDDLLREAVEGLFTESLEWSIVKVLDEYDTDTLIQQVEQIQPDVVVINQGDTANDLHLPTDWLDSHPYLNIIVINMESNLINIYNKQKVLIKQASDLFVIINQCPHQFQTTKGGAE